MFTLSCGKDIRNPNKLHRRDNLQPIFDYMMSDDYSYKIFDLRTTLDDDERKKIKVGLPYIVPAFFKTNSRKSADLEKSNGMILDIDHIDARQYFKRLKNEPLIHFMFVSPSGDGLKIGIKFDSFVTDPDIYKLVYKKCSEQFTAYYRLKTDNTCDAARACFLSGDDIYYNPDSTLWTPIYDEPKRYEPKEYAGETDLSELADICRETYISDYADWVKAGIALSSLGEEGRSLFKLLSLGKGSRDTEQQIDRKFDSFLKCDRVGIGTFYFIAKNYRR